MTKKIILWANICILALFFFTPPAHSKVIKLGRAFEANEGFIGKKIPGRNDPAAQKKECTRNKDCDKNGNADRFCQNSVCVPCEYSCPSGMSVNPTGTCENTSDVLVTKSNPYCASKGNCYTQGRYCNPGQVCYSNICTTCTYNCPIGYAETVGMCGSKPSSMNAVKNIPSCPNQPKTCYTPGTNCANSGQKCLAGSCVPMCTGVACSADTQKCNTTTGGCDVCCTAPTNGYCKDCKPTTCSIGFEPVNKTCTLIPCETVVANKGYTWKAVKNLSEFNAAMNNSSVSTIVLFSSISTTDLVLNKTKTIAGPKFLPEASCQSRSTPTITSRASSTNYGVTVNGYAQPVLQSVNLTASSTRSNSGEGDILADSRGLVIQNGNLTVHNATVNATANATVDITGDGTRNAITVAIGIWVNGGFNAYNSSIYGYGQAYSNGASTSISGWGIGNATAYGIEVNGGTFVADKSTVSAGLWLYTRGFDASKKGNGYGQAYGTPYALFANTGSMTFTNNTSVFFNGSTTRGDRDNDVGVANPTYHRTVCSSAGLIKKSGNSSISGIGTNNSTCTFPAP